MLLPFALLMENQWWVKFLVSFQELRQWKQIVLSVAVLSTVMHLLKKKPVSLKNILHAAAAAKSLQSCPTLCGPIDGSPPGFPVPGILQAGTLEWVAISLSNV